MRKNSQHCSSLTFRSQEGDFRVFTAATSRRCNPSISTVQKPARRCKIIRQNELNKNEGHLTAGQDEVEVRKDPQILQNEGCAFVLVCQHRQLRSVATIPPVLRETARIKDVKTSERKEYNFKKQVEQTGVDAYLEHAATVVVPESM